MAKILIVDDDPNMLRLMSAYLKPNGYEVLEAKDGDEALMLVEGERLDAVLLDYMMRGMSGPETCSQIKQRVDYFLPVVIVTALSDAESRLHGFDCGADDYLTKPFDPHELLARVRALLRTKSVYDDLLRASEENEMLMSDLRDKNEMLTVIAVTDELTGLHNRRYFNQRLKEETARASREDSPIACIMMDVDEFKAINDTYGHEVGDTVLKAVAEILRNGVRVADVVARIGGDEFAILLSRTDSAAAAEMAGRLRELIECHRIEAGDKRLRFTASFGVTSLNSQFSGFLPEDLLRSADKALYDAKSTGNDVCTYLSQSDKSMETRSRN